MLGTEHDRDIVLYQRLPHDPRLRPSRAVFVYSSLTAGLHPVFRYVAPLAPLGVDGIYTSYPFFFMEQFHPREFEIPLSGSPYVRGGSPFPPYDFSEPIRMAGLIICIP